MRIPSQTTRKFWQYYRELPPEIHALARKNYRLWAADALHPSLHFKAITKPNWSARVGENYRAVGTFVGSTFLWIWIGPHSEYDKRF